MMVRLLLIFLGFILPLSAMAQSRSFADDNSDSVAVIIGNQNYRYAQSFPVEYAINDAKAIREYLIRFLHFEERNIIYEENATKGVLEAIFRPDGRLMGRVIPDRSNVFVFYSGHGVPDVVAAQPYLLPADTLPDSPQDGYALEALYASLDGVKQKIGADRQVIVMIDACFTGETGRGKNILRNSAPGFAPALPVNGGKLIKLVATTGTHAANWDDNLKLGLFTSRFLMGVAGLAKPDRGVIPWGNLRSYVRSTVEGDARRLGREQKPEIMEASLTLPVGEVEAVHPGMQKAHDEAAWREAVDAAEASPDYFGKMRAYQDYSVHCLRNGCGHLDEADRRLKEIRAAQDADDDRADWARRFAARDFQGYLSNCRPPCAYRKYAQDEIDRERSTRNQQDAEDDRAHWATRLATRDFQGYIDNCHQPCTYRTHAQDEIAREKEARDRQDAEEDRAHWTRRLAAHDYRGYLNNCRPPCAYRRDAQEKISQEAVVVVPPPRLCDGDRLTAWLRENGAYGDQPLDTSIYDSQVNWIADGEKPWKTRDEITKEEENDRKRYAVQKYTPTTLGVYQSGDQCVIKQKFNSYKVRNNGKQEYSAFNITYWIRTDAYGRRSIAGQKIERLASE
jgi:hypothetical protein